VLLVQRRIDVDAIFGLPAGRGVREQDIVLVLADGDQPLSFIPRPKLDDFLANDPVVKLPHATPNPGGGSNGHTDPPIIAIAAGFAYLAAILDAWSRRVVGYAISRSVDARLALAALKAALRTRRPPSGCVHHSDSECMQAGSAWRSDLRLK
jgi:hypothetical protein